MYYAFVLLASCSLSVVVSTGRLYKGGSSIMQVDPQHSMSLQPDSVIVWMNDVIEMLNAMMIDASAVITIVVACVLAS